jgi:glucuronate isomerase
VWEVLRKTGVPEEKITGNASPHDKFIAMANVFDQIAGNPVYEWIHLDLRFLGVTELLNAETRELIWNKVNEILGLRMFGSISPENTASMAAAKSVNEVKILETLENGDFYVEFLPKVANI